MTPDQIEHMVKRFLAWRLPANFRPDNGISYTRPNYAPEIDATPNGTNLFDYTQAEAMVRHMVDGLPAHGPAGYVSVPRDVAEMAVICWPAHYASPPKWLKQVADALAAAPEPTK